jgi:hypothetical protein
MQYDHVCAEYQSNKRLEKNFITADCLPLDLDNDFSENPDDWKTPADVRAAFPEVVFYTVESRSHMKVKDGKTARPKYHYYFPIDSVSDVAEYKAMKKSVWRLFPAFDGKALDGARFFYGVKNPVVEYYEGNITLSEFMKSAEVHKTPEPKPKAKSRAIPVGSRNSTLSLKASQFLKRYGDNSEARRHYDNWCQKCEPRLSQEEEDRIFESGQQFYHSVIKKSPTYKPPDEFTEVPPFAIPTETGYVISPPLLADYYLERHTVIIEIDSGDPRVHEYENDVYQYRMDLEVKAVLGEYISSFRRALCSTAKTTETYKLIIQNSRLFVKQEQLNSETNFVCMKNGLLNLREWKLHPHNPDVYFTTQLDCEFTERFPSTPNFNKATIMFSEGDSEKGEFLWQFIGVVLSNIPGYKFKRFLLTIGKRDSGKTVLKRLTECLVGKGNYNNCDLVDLETNRFAVANLQHKRLSGSNDLRSAKIPEAGKLKLITGGDSLPAERKGEQGFDMIYTGLVWHVGNDRPYYGGRQDDALYQREILFEINHVIPD